MMKNIVRFLVSLTIGVHYCFADTAILLDEPPNTVMSGESQYVEEIAGRLFQAAVLHPSPDGGFFNRCGKSVAAGDYSTLWIHHGDILDTKSRLRLKPFVQTLRDRLVTGSGVLLTGGAVELLGDMQVDAVQKKPITFGNDRAQLGLVPVEPSHPVFTGLDFERGVLWFSNAAFPSFDDFTAPKGKLLARNPGGPATPFLEYSLEKGKILAIPMQIGRLYDKAPQGHRKNLEAFISNAFRYLDGSLVEPAPIKSEFDDVVHALDLSIRNLSEAFGAKYPNANDYLARLAVVKEKKDLATLESLRREALLASPLLDFERILMVRRGERQLGLPLNYTANSSLPKKGYDNRIVLLSGWKTPALKDSPGKLTSIFVPKDDRFVGDVELHFDAQRILVSTVDEKNRWRVFEQNLDGGGLREVPLIPDDDVDCFDACYLPDDRIVFCSTACFAGVPCVNGSAHTCNLYRLENDGDIRQLTYEQDQDWCPTLLANGRLLYLRWEYTDIPHAFSRILFHANPDGTNQSEYYGSGSYWPGSMFFAKPIPNHPTKFVAIVGGHHELPRMGDLVVFDPARGRREADGAIQRIPGRNRSVEPVMLDLPIAQTWPKFLHPFPLNENYFLVSAKPAADKPWGVYLVDTFDNMVLLHEEPGFAMFEPIPVRKTPRPPAIPDRIDPLRKDADVFIANIYQGEGLRGVPRGTVKSLRIVGYQFAYQEMGAEPYSVGMDGPWDPRQVLGTVTVQEDGSAAFKVPAYLPFAIQPLDEEGKAVQIMRSWITAMPGEVVSCVGCHENQNTIPPPMKSKAAESEPSEPTPWYGPRRGFSFVREIQPVLDKYCTECHQDGNTRGAASLQDTPPAPLQKNNNYINVKSRFSQSYYELRRFVRTPTKEGDMRVCLPWEYHADTSRLVQLLQGDHYGVKLDDESWDRLVTWIDLNAPFHGNWRDIIMNDDPNRVKKQFERRHDMRRRYAKVDTLLDDDPNVEYPVAVLGEKASFRHSRTGGNQESTHSFPIASSTSNPSAMPLQATTEAETPGLRLRGDDEVGILLDEAISIDLVPVPALNGKTFFMGVTEITNEQFATFDPEHDSRIEHADFMQFSPGERGWTLSMPKQPVVRVSWNRAMEFCDRLSKKSGRKVTLPTVAQWEHACRAGADTPFWYGNIDTDFSPFANLSDISNGRIDPFGWTGRRDTLPDWRPADSRFNDRSRVSAPVGSYRPNSWGLYDMHGNVAEWTRDGKSRKTVCGGSWYDVPKRAQVGFRQYYRPEQQVFDVGFRVVVETD